MRTHPVWDNMRPVSLEFKPPRLTVDVSSTDNSILVASDNIQALRALVPNMRNKIKCIYIDPAWLTGDTTRGYDDNGKGNSNLDHFREVVILLRELMRDDGIIFVHCDSHALVEYGSILKETFGSGREIPETPIVWQDANWGRGHSRAIQDVLSYIFVFTKKNGKLNTVKIHHPDLTWKPRHLNGRPVSVYSCLSLHDQPCTLLTNGRKCEPLMTDEGTLAKGGKPVFWKYQDESIVPSNLWDRRDREVRPLRANDTEAREVGPLHETSQKPLGLLRRIIQMGSNVGDIILDCYLGTGTTAIAASELNRRWIGIETLESQLVRARRRLSLIPHAEAKVEYDERATPITIHVRNEWHEKAIDIVTKYLSNLGYEVRTGGTVECHFIDLIILKDGESSLVDVKTDRSSVQPNQWRYADALAVVIGIENSPTVSFFKKTANPQIGSTNLGK